jgi:hypothetical protein
MAGFAPESLAGFSPESVAGFAPERWQELLRNTQAPNGDLADSGTDQRRPIL